ncbi:MAG: hypothetical protein EOO61_08170, partial [Hymenobacter sp.]
MNTVLQMSMDLVSESELSTSRANSSSYTFSLQSLRVIFACVNDMVVWVRYSPNSDLNSQRAMLDIDLCDVDGNICVQIKDLMLQPVNETVNQQASVVLASPTFSVVDNSFVTPKPKSVQLASLNTVNSVNAITASTAKPKATLLQSATSASKLVLSASSNQHSSVKVSPSHIVEEVNVVENPSSYTNAEAAPSLDQLQQQLRVSLAEALYLKTSDIDNEKSFVDLGLDSIVGVEWVKVINKKYGLAISATRVYD